MQKFEVYQLGKLPPLTVVEADWWEITTGNVLKFCQRDGTVEDNLRKVAMFNWSNVAGFKEIENTKPLNNEQACGKPSVYIGKEQHNDNTRSY